MLRRVGWLALAMAGSGAILYVLRATEFGVIYTDWTRSVPEALVLALPGYLAMLGMVVPAIPISLLLHRGGFGPPPLRATALVAAILGVITFVLLAIAAYDAMWALYVGPFGLDVPVRRPVFPPDVTTVTSTLGPAFMGTWMAVTSLQLASVGVARVLCGLGLVTGLGIIATMPYAGDQFVYRTLLPLELIVSLAWAASVGVYLTTTKGVTATA